MRGSRGFMLVVSLAVLAVCATACADDDEATGSPGSDVPVSETSAPTVAEAEPSTTDVQTDVDGGADDSDMPWTLEHSMPGELDQVVVWSDGFAGIMDLDGAETLDGGAIWYSPDGIEWAERLDGDGPGDDVFTLVGHQGELFALSGPALELDEDKTLWHRPADGPWSAVLTDPRLELLAVGGDRLFAYSQNGFQVPGVFDTATLEQVDYGGLPEVDLAWAASDPAEDEFGPMLYQGRAIALDDGFLAQVSWLMGKVERPRIRWKLFFSEDASTWIEHPSPPAGTPILSYGATSAPVYDGINLLGDSGPSGSWLTDTGFDFERTTVPGIAGVDTISTGFVTVDDFGRIHVSTDGSTWTSLPAPPTWHAIPGETGFAHGTILDADGGLLAIGVRGKAGWIGPLDPTTEIWTSAMDLAGLGDR